MDDNSATFRHRDQKDPITAPRSWEARISAVVCHSSTRTTFGGQLNPAVPSSVRKPSSKTVNLVFCLRKLITSPSSIVTMNAARFRNGTPGQYSHPVIVIEDEPAVCLCASAVPITWEVTHARGQVGTCTYHACSDCWFNWVLGQSEQITDVDCITCICNRAAVSMATIQAVLTAGDFEKYAT